MTRQRLRGTNITRQAAGLGEVSHINGAKFEPLIPDMNINHGWKIHGDFVKDIASQDEAMAKIGIQRKGAIYEIADQSIWDATAARLDKLGINTATNSNNLYAISEGLIFQKNTEISPKSVQTVNGRQTISYAQFDRKYSNPLDTISMMEVFDENQTQFKASALYGEGREFTGYTQSIENRDKLISSLESRLGDRLEDVNPNILGGDQTEGATKLSNKITGRFTTEYTDVPSAGGAMDWSSQNPAASKGQAAIDNVMATNPQMRPYIHTGVIDDQSAANLKKLTDDFPIFNEMLHGPKGYVSPYGTIEDTFNQQGYDYKTGSAVKSAPVTPQAAPVSPPPTSGPNVANTNANKAIPLADEYDTGATSARVASGQPITTPPPSAPPKAPPPGTTPPKTPPPKGPSGLGTPTNVKTQPGAHGGGGGRPPAPPRPPGPPPPPPGPPSPPPGPPTTSPTGPTAKIVNNVQGNNLTAREALRGIGEDIKAARKPGQRLLSADGSKAMAEAVTRGIKGSRNLKMLAVGSALGLGGYAANRVANRDNPLDLEG
jgi:hypothetical protein